jgi:hypothetical protein
VDLNKIVVDAIKKYNGEVKARTFPALAHTYPMEEVEFQKFLHIMKQRQRRDCASSLQEKEAAALKSDTTTRRNEASADTITCTTQADQPTLAGKKDERPS